MAKYHMRPIVVEAEQFFPDKPLPFSDRGCPVVHQVQNVRTSQMPPYGCWYVNTIHGDVISLSPGDWVILESNGKNQAYSCKPDIFAATYDLME